MKKYLNYNGLIKLWAKVKDQDTLTYNTAKNYIDEQLNNAKNAIQNSINNNSAAITTLNGYFNNGISNKALGDKNGNDITTTYIKSATRGSANGVCPLGSDSKIPNAYLPSYVDDVLEYDTFSNFPATGEAGKIYVTKDTNKTYRWSGTQYTEISSSLALGTTSSTAYSGDKGVYLENEINNVCTQTNQVDDKIEAVLEDITEYTYSNQWVSLTASTSADLGTEDSPNIVFYGNSTYTHTSDITNPELVTISVGSVTTTNATITNISGNNISYSLRGTTAKLSAVIKIPNESSYKILFTDDAITDSELEELLV